MPFQPPARISDVFASTSMFGPPDQMSGGNDPLLGMLFGNDQFGQLAQTGLSMLGANLANQTGMMPGPFSGFQSVYAQHQARQQMALQMTAMGEAARQEQGQVYNMIRGAYGMFGREFDAHAQASATAMAGDFGKYAPFVLPAMEMMAPGLADFMGFGRTMFAQQAATSMRYRLDPATGQLGYSAASITALGEGIHNQFYGEGVSPLLSRGIPMGQMGSLMATMQMQGLAPRSIRDDITDEDIRRISGGQEIGEVLGSRAGRLRPSELSALGGLSGASIEEITKALPQIDSDRWVQGLGRLNGAVSALREVFGPGAQMSQLVSALDALTAGTYAAQDPAQLESKLRQLFIAGERGNIPVSVNMQNVARFSQLDAALGGTGEGGYDAARYAVLVAASMKASGASEFQMASGQTAQQIAADAGQLYLQAGHSPVAGQLATTLRLGRIGFTPGSEAEALFKAIDEGRKTYGPDNKSVYINSEDEWQRIVGTGGVDAETALMSRHQHRANQAAVRNSQIAGLTVQIGREEDFNPGIEQAFQHALAATRAPSSVVGDAAAAMRQVIHNFVPMAGASPEAVHRALVQELQSAAGQVYNAAGLASPTEQQINAGREQVGEFMGEKGTNLDAYMARARAAGAVGATEFSVNAAGDLQKLMSSFGSTTIGQRLAKMAGRKEGAEGVMPAINELLGNIRSEDIHPALAEEQAKLKQQIAEYEKLADTSGMVENGQWTHAGREARKSALQKVEDVMRSMTAKEKELGIAPAPEAAAAEKPKDGAAGADGRAAGGPRGDKLEIIGTLTLKDERQAVLAANRAGVG